MNKKIVVLGIVVIVLGVLGWYYYPVETPVDNVNNEQVVEPVVYTEEELMAEPWQTYRNEKYGFTIEYPGVWSGEVKESVLANGVDGWPEPKTSTEIWVGGVQIYIIEDLTLEEYIEWFGVNGENVFRVGEYTVVTESSPEIEPDRKSYIFEKAGNIIRLTAIAYDSPEILPTRIKVVERMLETLTFDE